MPADPGPMTFGRLVRRHRERLLLTQEELARRSGLSSRAISYLEAEQVSRPRAASVRILAAALELDDADRVAFEAAALGSRTDRHPPDRPAAHRADADRVDADWPDADRVDAHRVHADRAGAGRVDADRVDADRTDADRMNADRTDADREDAGRPNAGRVARPDPADRERPVQRPLELPSMARAFVGRDTEIERLDQVVTSIGATGDPPDETTRIVLLTGAAGVGKTALAIRWAHRVAPLFPDGQVFVDLRGFSPSRPMRVATALGLLIDALDPGAELPPQIAARAARLRTLTTGRRMLIVLDNARSAEQVRPLLPGSAECAVVVTSRLDLRGLVVRDGAIRVPVPRLTPAAGLELLAELLPDRPDAARRTGADELLERCAHLPLAIRIAAESLAERPGLSVASLAESLADERRTLALLGVDDDPQTGVRDVLSWSYRLLEPPTARAFEILGAQPCATIDLDSAAALLGCDPDEAADLVGRLARSHLLDWTGPGERIGAHDLLRAYAHQLAGTADLDAAVGRLADHLLAVATRCKDLLYPYDSRTGRPAIDMAGMNEESAAAWLDRERDNLVLLGTHPALAHRAVEFSEAMWRYLFTRGLYAEAALLHEHAMTVAAARQDSCGEAIATRHLAGVRMRTGDYVEAMMLADRALELHSAAGDVRAAGAAHNLRGVLFERTGRRTEALAAYRNAHDVAVRLGDDVAIASTLNNVGGMLEELGRLDEAADHLSRALRVERRIGDRSGEGMTLGNLADVHRRARRYEQALALYDKALTVAREVGERNDEAYALDGSAGTLRRVGRLDEALERYRQTLLIARETGNKPIEASALCGLGETDEDSGRYDDAAGRFEEATALARALGDRYDEARALAGRGRVRRRLGDTAAARDLLAEAHDIYLSIGSPEATEVLTDLHALG